MNKPGKRLLWIGLAVVAAAAQLGAAGAAHADDAATPGKSLVVLGDSMAANVPYEWHTGGTICNHGATSWPNQLSTRLGTGPDDFVDESCTGATIDSGQDYTLTVQARAAAAADAFGPQTKMVALQFGLNDTWRDGEPNPYSQVFVNCAITAGLLCSNDDQSWVTDDHGLNGSHYADKVRKVVQYMRYYAPAAKIVLVGYPQEFVPGQNTLCVDLGPVQIQEHNGAVAGYFDRLEAAQRDAAQLLGVEYLDVRALNAGHEECATDPWVQTFDLPDVGLPLVLHPRPQLETAVSEALAAEVAG
ncbi:SGNH/GDSL hydrolase family protein [Nocardia stercoris]|uniref:SGNH/GDSL hydrolase family protein n=1 Tax=Nocardia stercoris TaxID=2483361 RepID=A0A3M2KRA9_9NOCA|nr:SGNH/GDSL hydrolase family protein [Nocardia stercoris]RMI28187.1 SGNH/GDSL hydrolase family protein [Nocardia stercoris]